MPLVLIAVAVIVAVVLIAFTVVFWREIAEWLKRVVKSLQEGNLQGVLEGTQLFLKKVGRKFRKMAVSFSRLFNSDKWMKYTTINEELIDFQKVPEDIRRKAEAESSDTVDITKETKAEMELAYSR